MLCVEYLSAAVQSQSCLLYTSRCVYETALKSCLHFDPKSILRFAAFVTQYSRQGGYTFETSAIGEIVILTEKLLADYRYLLLEDDSFQDLLTILDIYAQSGWPDAMELLGRFDEIFK